MKRIWIASMMLVISLLAACATKGLGPAPITPVEAESFADEFFAKHMQELEIPGLVFVLVKDGEVLLAKGYGYASLEDEVAVDPHRTVFRIGSVSKPFVAFAVMQLAEQGFLDLDQDVNHYLDAFQILSPFPGSVTLAHLLTHTSGIQDPAYVSNTDAFSRQPLREYLADHLPPISTPPGEQFAYSNHGYALAAYIVEEVTGIPFHRYVQENILQPLSMDNSRYLLSPPSPGELAQGYTLEGDAYIPEPLDYDHDYPGGALVSTAADMANFMLVLLNAGCYSETCILEAHTLAEMQTVRFQTPYDNIGQTYGFIEGNLNGARILGHTGAIRGFGSSMELFPESGVGYFLSFNLECWGSSACDIIPLFRKAFVEHFLAQ